MKKKVIDTLRIIIIFNKNIVMPQHVHIGVLQPH